MNYSKIKFQFQVLGWQIYPDQQRLHRSNHHNCKGLKTGQIQDHKSKATQGNLAFHVSQHRVNTKKTTPNSFSEIHEHPEIYLLLAQEDHTGYTNRCHSNDLIQHRSWMLHKEMVDQEVSVQHLKDTICHVALDLPCERVCSYRAHPSHMCSSLIHNGSRNISNLGDKQNIMFA